MKRIIKSLLDNDMYKFTQANAVFNLYPNERVTYKFYDRSKQKIYDQKFKNYLKSEILKLRELKFTREELNWLKEKFPYFSATFFEFLKHYQFDDSEVLIDVVNGDLKLEVRGYWYRTIFWEVVLLAMISQIHYDLLPDDDSYGRHALMKINIDKIKALDEHKVYFADFGTRRRFSAYNHDNVIKDFINYKSPCFVGTSNLYFAKEYNINPIGTQAHEWIMFHGAKYGYLNANKIAMDKWTEVYNGNLGIVLTDTFGTDLFFYNFDSKYAKLYDGVRHDSGDPYIFGEKVIKHYEKLGINPKSKTIVFSDGLNTASAINIKKYFNGKIKTSFGIGTHFTNDVGVQPMNIVIKLDSVITDLGPVRAVKTSDVEGKHIGPELEIIAIKNLTNKIPFKL